MYISYLKMGYSQNLECRQMKIKFIGTGTSTGVPQLRCDCPACVSSAPRDKRFRASALISTSSDHNILIDCGPDFHSQILREGCPNLDGLLLTHSHYDHVGGVDDLRPYCNGSDFPIWCQADVANDLRQRNPWSFGTNLYPGVPTFCIHEISPNDTFFINNIKITALRVFHGDLPILGYKFESPEGHTIAYITDCKTLPEETINQIRNVDLLVINALRFINPHHAHLTVQEALEIVKEANPQKTAFTHICHQMGPHASVSLPENIVLSYDTLEIEV